MRHSYNIHGVSLNLSSSNQAFLTYAHNYLRGFETASAPEAEINVSVSFLSGFSLRLQRTQYAPQRLGTGLDWDAVNNTLYVAQREIEARITLTSPWHAEVTFKKNLFKHIANKLFFAGAQTHERYYRSVIRLIAQQLVFMQLMLRWNVVPLSAAAAELGGKAYIFAGLPGSGKSTLTRALHKKLGARILTENFVLTDGERLFPFPEGSASVHADVQPLPIAEICVLTHGEKFLAYELPREQAYYTLLAINSLTAELPEHSAYGALTLVDPTRWQFLFDADHETLKKLCERHSCMRLVADIGLSKTLEYFSSRR